MKALALNANSNQQEILGLLNTWLSGIKEGMVERVTSCYSKNAALWGSITKRLRCDEQGIKQYFEEFIQSKKNGLNVMFKEIKMTEIAGVPVLSGEYVFTWQDENGQSMVLPASYTFVLNKRKGQWKIEDHHSTIIAS